MTQRTILHIDFDSFFASVEQQHNPSLRGKPLGVTATNDRTCIIASSREAKKLGIKTGARTYEAKKICPSLLLVSADFVKYWKISQLFLRICSNYSPFVEVFSIDEVFIDVSKTHHLFGGVDCIISCIKHRIKTEIGEYITVSVGVSHNKLLAKLASGLNKPNGFMKITPNDIDTVFASAKLTDICGIGEKIAARLNRIGVDSFFDIRHIPFTRLVAEFGKIEAYFLKNVAHGIDETAVIPYTTAPLVKSVGRNYCLPKNEYNKRVVLQHVYELCEEVGIKLRRLNKKARTIGCYLHGDISIHGRKTITQHIDSGKDIFDLCLQMFIQKPFSQKENTSCYIRQIGIWVSSLEETNNLTLSLFSQTKITILTKTVDAINEKFGDHTIRNGFLLYADKLTTVPNGYMADKYERTKLAEESQNFAY